MSTWRLPAEWEPQKAIMLTWPTEDSDWREQLEAIQQIYIVLAHNISQYQEVIIVYTTKAHKNRIVELLEKKHCNIKNIHFYQSDINDTWARDHGPITVKCENENKILDFTFNGWGNKFDAKLDNLITKNLYQQNAFSNNEYERIDFVFEGGAIESNGEGLLMTTTTCLLNPNRNGSITRDKVEAALRAHINFEKMLWLENAYLVGDDTDGHIDMLARFCNSNTICYMNPTDAEDPNYTALKALEKELLHFAEQAEHSFQVIPLPLPSPVFYHGNRLAASYCNFLITNKQVIVPIYGVPEDKQALTILQELFHARKVIGIDARAAIAQGGSLHCLTMQIPL